MEALEQAYAHCRRIARSQARNFYYAFVLLPRDRRKAMCAIYAFMRRSDDIADNHAATFEARRAQLQEWRSQLAAALDGGSSGDAVLAAFADTVERFSIPHAYFFELLDGMESDLAAREYRTFGDLRQYCYRAAGVVGLSTVHVLGFQGEDALGLAEKCGIAFQLTNIMRDVAEDAAMGRVYFPTAELRDHGMTRQELMDGAVLFDDRRFQEFMEFQWQRAERFYRESAGLLPRVQAPSRPALWALIAIYRGLLGRIRLLRYDVLERRVSLPVRTKLWIVARAAQLRIAGGVPSLPR